MKNKSLLYIHGLASSGASSTVENLVMFLPDIKIVAPDLPINPQNALSLLHDICRTELPDIIIGTSMGGMFAQQMRGYKKILVNPAFHVSGFMRKNIGTHIFFNPRKDGNQNFEITESLCDAYESIEKYQFENIDEQEKQKTWALFGTDDTLVNCQEEYLAYYDQFQLFEGEHRLNKIVIVDNVIPLIQQVINAK